jgi:hypothetical protein
MVLAVLRNATHEYADGQLTILTEPFSQSLLKEKRVFALLQEQANQLCGKETDIIISAGKPRRSGPDPLDAVIRRGGSIIVLEDG